MTPHLQIRRKSKESKEIDPVGKKESPPKSGEIPLAKVFSYFITGSIGFHQITVLVIELVQKGAVDDRRFCIFSIFLLYFSPHVSDFPFRTYRSDTQTHRKVNWFLYIEKIVLYWYVDKKIRSTIIFKKVAIKNLNFRIKSIYKLVKSMCLLWPRIQNACQTSSNAAPSEYRFLYNDCSSWAYWKYMQF